jgi:hypothetical protein
MSSFRQIEANRRNALNSTGPVTPEGKETSSRNAVRHGLTSETVIVGVEDQEDYRAFEAAVVADYDAESAVERELVLRLASVLWRLRRATGIETSLFEFAGEKPAPSERQTSSPEFNPATQSRGLYAVGPSDEHDATEANNLNRNAMQEIGDRFVRLTELPTFAPDRLARYEHLLWRQARQLIFTLESLRRRTREPRRSSFPFSLRSRGREGCPD